MFSSEAGNYSLMLQSIASQKVYISEWVFLTSENMDARCKLMFDWRVSALNNIT